MSDTDIADDRFVAEIRSVINQHHRRARRSRWLYFIWLIAVVLAVLYPWYLARQQQESWQTALQNRSNALARDIARETSTRDTAVGRAVKGIASVRDSAMQKIDSAKLEFDRFIVTVFTHDRVVRNLIANLRIAFRKDLDAERIINDSNFTVVRRELDARITTEDFRHARVSLDSAIGTRLDTTTFTRNIARIDGQLSTKASLTKLAKDSAALRSGIDDRRSEIITLKHNLDSLIDAAAKKYNAALASGLKPHVAKEKELDTQIANLIRRLESVESVKRNDSPSTPRR